MRATFFWLGAATMLMLRGQATMNGPSPGEIPILFSGDMAALDSGEARKDLECTVDPLKALIGFDLKFHTGYDVTIPLKELEGTGNTLSIVFRVTPKGHDSDAVYFQQRIRVPPVEDHGGQVTLEGNFDVGEGSYQVDWLMRDFGGRLCSTSWTVDAARTQKDRQMPLALGPNMVRETPREAFQPEPPVQRAEQPGLRVKVLVNFAPQQAQSAALAPMDTLALVSILRNIARRPQIGKFSLVLFNIQSQNVLLKENSVDQIDFPAMGSALKNLTLGTVRASQLGQKNGDVTFLSTLIKGEISEGPAPDALIFVSPKTLIDQSVPQDDLKQIGDLPYPVFYMNYDADPRATPWRDAIGRAVKFFKGREYTITGPRDLWDSVTEMVSRIAQSKQERQAAAQTIVTQRPQ